MTRSGFYVAGFAALVAVDTFTQVAFKLATSRTGTFTLTAAWFQAAASSPWLYGAIGGYLAAFFVWMTLLERAPVGPAFAASHLDVVTVMAISVPLFAERISLQQWIGAGCIVAGILMLSRHPHESSL